MMYRDGPTVSHGRKGTKGMTMAHAGTTMTRRREATRERVLDAARDVFAERGVYGGSVEEICARAGFTRGAFYSNFSDKDDVLRALIAREHDRLLDHLDAAFGLVDETAAAVTGDPRPVLAPLADRILRSVPADRLFSLIQEELEIHAIRDPAVARAFVEADARFRSRVGDFMVRALGRFGRELTVPPDLATDAVIAIVERSSRRALLAGPEADPNAMATAILPLLMVALSRPR
jgi:AcrR family transcriptional regulator